MIVCEWSLSYDRDCFGGRGAGEDDFISFVSFGTGEVMTGISTPVDY